ncbi:Rv1476 family membrane protein [Corynebacterium freiburgense]|uniref:Rv1476 family membrane protein n=1 Tax=Corynebacterium freiburgense TaxID=556548 RepID=UPI000419D1F0|nr:DUF6676 family protein [Corynebacterium freiburgense]WJZ02683.1 hypothetical protein CFREI_06990 [Corynebacterium freiburgense]
MIPQDVDLDALAADINEDSVAVGTLGEQYPNLESELEAVAQQARADGHGEYAFVALDRMPDMPADMRDIAQELLLRTQAETVVVRSPYYGTIVSSEHTRADIEAAEKVIFNDPNYVGSFRWLTENLGQEPVSWGLVHTGLLAVVIVTIVLAFLSFRSVKS